MLLDLCRENEGNPFSTKIWVVGSYTDTLLNPQNCCRLITESSFNMAREGEDIEGGLRKFVYFKTNRNGVGRAPKNLSR